jgi:hypothetical protein
MFWAVAQTVPGHIALVLGKGTNEGKAGVMWFIDGDWEMNETGDLDAMVAKFDRMNAEIRASEKILIVEDVFTPPVHKYAGHNLFGRF